MSKPRRCNVGPVPPYKIGDLTQSLVQYVDREKCDSGLFEMGEYAAKQKSGGLSLKALAKLSNLITELLAMAPWARLHKVDLKKAFLDALAKKPLRVIFPKIPKQDLAEMFSRQAVDLFGLMLKMCVCLTNINK